MSDSSWEADGLASLSDAERVIGISIPDELDANTLSGLCLGALGELPKEGDVVTEYGYQFSIQSVANHRIEKLRIEKLSFDKLGVSDEGSAQGKSPDSE